MANIVSQMQAKDGRIMITRIITFIELAGIRVNHRLHIKKFINFTSLKNKILFKNRNEKKYFITMNNEAFSNDYRD